MAKLSDLSLAELYQKEKITTAVHKNILAKEDFTQLSDNYCERVCALKHKCINRQPISQAKADVVILQDHNAVDEKYKTGDWVERDRRKVLNFLARQHLPGMSFKLVNTLRCKVTKEELGRKSSLTQSVILKCGPYALEEIRSAEPKVIICLTTPGCKLLGLKDQNSNKSRGEIHYWNGIPVVITLHPRYLMMIRQNASGKMWGPDFLEVIERDFIKAGQLARGELVIPDIENVLEWLRQRTIFARTLEDVRVWSERLLSLPEGSVISFDLETTGLDPFDPEARILTAQFGFKDDDGEITPVVFPLWHRENKGYNPAEAWKFIVPILVGPRAPLKVGHNLKFDILYTAVTQGVRLTNVAFDTMLLLHDINSGIQENYGLKRAVWDFLPFTGLGGYEDRLPGLSTAAQIRRYEESLNAEDD